jgi:ELWxxDGT repeat protein
MNGLTYSSDFGMLGANYFFTANDGVSGNEIWKTGGTGINTTLLSDINPGNASSSPSFIIKTTNKIYFTATSAASGTELYVTDGTPGGTILLKDINPGAASSTIIAANAIIASGDNIYFLANNGTNGNELWYSDGTAVGTVSLGDIFPGAGTGFTNGLSSPFYMRGNGNELYFIANNQTNGEELWKSDGTLANTALVKDILAGTPSSSITFFGFTNNTLFFTANDGTNGKELWRSDGTPAGTYLLKDLNPGAGNCNIIQWITYQNKFIFRHFISPYPTYENILWQSDGTVANTFSVAISNNILWNINNTNSIINSNFYIFNNDLYYVSIKDANTIQDTLKLHKITGSITTNTVVKTYTVDVNSPDNIADFVYLKPQSASYFNIVYNVDYAAQTERWYRCIFSDGTPGGTNFMPEVIEYHGWLGVTTSSNYKPLPNFPSSNDVLAFCASSPSVTSNPKRIDLSTGNATQLSASVQYPAGYGMSSVNPFRTAVVNNKIYFAASAPGIGVELGESDGTAGGTAITLDIYPGSNSCFNNGIPADAFYPAASGGKLFFTANDNINGTELWSLGTGNVGVKENNTSLSAINVYPNPANEYFTVSSASSDIHSVEIFDLLGKKVKSFIGLNSKKLNVDTKSFNSGVYFVNIETDGKTFVKKIVVE